MLTPLQLLQQTIRISKSRAQPINNPKMKDVAWQSHRLMLLPVIVIRVCDDSFEIKIILSFFSDESATDNINLFSQRAIKCRILE